MLYYYLKHCFKAYLIWTFKYKEFKAPATFCLIIFKSFNIKYTTGNISKQDTYSFIFPFNGKIKLKTANIQTSLFFFFLPLKYKKKINHPDVNMTKWHVINKCYLKMRVLSLYIL